MSKARIMSAGTVGTSKRVRVNGPEGGGNALQGLPPICNMRSALVPYVRTRSDGSDRNLIFCVNQLGGVGAKRGQFGPGNRSGVGKTGGCGSEGQYGGRYFGTALHGMLGVGVPVPCLANIVCDDKLADAHSHAEWERRCNEDPWIKKNCLSECGRC